MKYIYDDHNGFTIFHKYFEYIYSIKEKLSDDLYHFASDENRYNLHSKGSLHDSWIDTFHINYSSDDTSSAIAIGKRTKHAHLKLLGPYHDRFHQFTYSNVKGLSFKNLYSARVGHDDLLYFEIRYCEGFLEHEILFDNDVELLIICSDIKYEELCFA